MTENNRPESNAEYALSVWMEMWNTGSEIARRICSDDFRIHFGTSEPDGSDPGDDVRSADAFADFLDWYRSKHPSARFAAVHSAVDGEHGRMVWDVRAGDRAVGGIDIFDFTPEGLIAEVWSVTGTRRLA